jgi:sodium-dependent dicarboxylate transporter 2/3/5
MVIFTVTATAWITRVEPFGGWSGLLATLVGSRASMVGDSTVALMGVIACFIVPNGQGGALLDWKSAARIPWGLLLLFGGGIALAAAFEESGLSTTLGDLLGQVATLPVILLILLICLGVTFLTEVTSNTATTTLLMPILASAAIGAHLDPRLLMIPATLSASCAFMLPVATAPNAIVFGTERITIREMAREGIWLNFIGAAALTLVCYVLLGHLD